VFLEALELPRGREREVVVDGDHRYELNGEPTAYVLNALIERLQKEIRTSGGGAQRTKESFVPVPGPAKRQNTASYHARTSAGRAGMVTLPQGA